MLREQLAPVSERCRRSMQLTEAVQIRPRRRWATSTTGPAMVAAVEPSH
eukprot:SAG31_NODE_317_length_17813_cov_5.788585_17_plen_49_part_00